MPQLFAPSSNRWTGWPVRSAARDGAHDGELQKAWVNNTPSAATLSNTGVRTTLSPQAPAWGHAQLSAIARRILGRVLTGLSAAADVLVIPANSKQVIPQRWRREGWRLAVMAVCIAVL